MESVFNTKKKYNLDFVLPKAYRSDECKIPKHNIVLLIHVYYSEIFWTYLKYIKNIPEEVDVVFTVSNADIERELRKRQGEFQFEYKIVKKENQGRDVSALLVAAKNILLQYQYIGFLHDKKEKNCHTKDDVDEWNYCLWENMLGSKAYVHNVIATLKSDEKLGLLVPPIPITKNLDYGYTNTWALNFRNAEELARKLSFDCELNEMEPPIALGTIFWAKKSAIEKMLCHNWKYADFAKEPLEDDGTISHAIERLLPYVAQDAGFYTGWVMSDEYAAKRIEDQYHVITDVFTLLRRLHGIQYVSQLDKYLYHIMEVSEFCRKFTKVYIYGTGNNGKECFRELLNLRVFVGGFIVSRGFLNGHEQCYGINVQTLEEAITICPVHEIGILVAVQEKYQQEILELILSVGIDEEKIYIWETIR